MSVVFKGTAVAIGDDGASAVLPHSQHQGTAVEQESADLTEAGLATGFTLPDKPAIGVSFTGGGGVFHGHYITVSSGDDRPLSDLATNDSVVVGISAPNTTYLSDRAGRQHSTATNSVNETREMDRSTAERLLTRLQGLEELSREYGDQDSLRRMGRAFTALVRTAAFSSDPSGFMDRSGLGTFLNKPENAAD